MEKGHQVHTTKEINAPELERQKCKTFSSQQPELEPSENPRQWGGDEMFQPVLEDNAIGRKHGAHPKQNSPLFFSWKGPGQ